MVNVLEIEKKIFISILILASLHSPNAVVCAVSVYTSLVHGKACGYKIIKIMKIHIFHCTCPCKPSLYVYLLRQPRNQWSDVSVRLDNNLSTSSIAQRLTVFVSSAIFNLLKMLILSQNLCVWGQNRSSNVPTKRSVMVTVKKNSPTKKKIT